jgi:DHA2 family multidrug resistance protein
MQAALPLAAAPARATNKWAVATAVALGALLEIVDTSIVNVALTDMQAALSATLSQVSWVVSSYAIANVIILPLGAYLGHRYGKKRYFLFSLVGFTLASLLCGLATNLPMLIVARVLQGLTGGGLLAKAQSILFETFPKEEQAMAQGFFGAIVIAGPALGPTLGGYLVTNVDWRWIFLINLPLGALAIVLAVVSLPDDVEQPREQSPQQVDWTALLLMAVGLGSLQAFLEEGSAHDWFASRFIVALAFATVVGLVLFVRRTLATEAPVVDLRVLRRRSLWAGSLMSATIGAALYGTLFAVPIFAQTILGYSSEQTGMLLLPGALASAAAMPLAALLMKRTDPRALLFFGAVIMCGALYGLAQLSPSTGSDDLFWPLLVRSVGTVLMFLPLQLAALGPLPTSEVAAASGFFNLTRQLGGSIGVAVLTTLLDERHAFHRAVLNEHLVAGDPAVSERLAMITRGLTAQGFSLDVAKQKALGVLELIVNREALVMSFNDTFWATGLLVVASVPLILLLGKAREGAEVEMGH